MYCLCIILRRIYFLCIPFFFLIVIILLSGLIVTHYTIENNDHLDLQIETVKNNIILFLTTILPLYVFISIFRFQPIYLQILLSLLLTAFVFILSIFVRKLFDKLIKRISLLLTGFSPAKLIYLWLVLMIIIVSSIFIDLPTNSIRSALNLSDNVRYGTYDGFPIDLKNRFKAKNINQIEFNFFLDSEITDYYYDNNYLYLYTDNTTLIIYDLLNNKILYNSRLNHNTQISETNELINKFTFYDNQLILLGYDGLYKITPSGANKISNFNSSNTYKFYIDDILYFLHKKGKQNEIYLLNNEQLILIDEINLGEYNDIVVITEQLFYKDDEYYYIYDNPLIKFKIEKGFPIYDKKNKTIYISLNNSYPLYDYEDTFYYKITSDGEKQIFATYSFHNSKGIIIGDYIFFTEKSKNKLNRIEIMNLDLKFDSIHKHLKLQPFWYTNHYNYVYIANYQEKDNKLEYLHVLINKKHTLIRIIQLEEKDLGLNLPFYSHYGIGIFIIIAIALFIPITNYNKHVVTLGFLKKRREEINK